MPLRIPSERQVVKYLEDLLQKKNIRINYFGPLDQYSKNAEMKGGSKKSGGRVKQSGQSIKTLGYGIPYLVVYEVGSSRRESIISTLRMGRGFGHDYRADRVDNIVLSYDTWNSLPRHCRVEDFGAFSKKDSSMLSLGKSGEFFLLRRKIEGVEYYKDLDRVFSSEKLEERDLPRAQALASYLSRIHSKKNPKPEDAQLYFRKIRDTVGHGECIFGLADTYPSSTEEYLHPGELEEIEKKCVAQRWRLRKYASTRLSQVHGDFHPWNILFASERSTTFRLLDRSRGEWGEPADDVCALSINYIFYSLRKYGSLKGAYEKLFQGFLDTYLQRTNDGVILEAMPLFYTFRALVIASPLWYPSISSEIRRQIFNFVHNILDSAKFEPSRVNDYFQKR
ncbi:MAG TPA: hypothetical protein VFF30_11595 [Nitrososphaerales archaeon]|nr:hypothetical protein [Nitrososphaerales archaeon]